MIGSKIQVFKNERVTIFSFSENANDPEECGSHKIFQC